VNRICFKKIRPTRRYLTPEAGAFFAFAVSEKNFAFAKSSLASGAGELGLGGTMQLYKTLLQLYSEKNET
jgi:hypothetical protein